MEFHLSHFGNLDGAIKWQSWCFMCFWKRVVQSQHSSRKPIVCKYSYALIIHWGGNEDLKNMMLKLGPKDNEKSSQMHRDILFKQTGQGEVCLQQKRKHRICGTCQESLQPLMFWFYCRGLGFLFNLKVPLEEMREDNREDVEKTLWWWASFSKQTNKQTISQKGCEIGFVCCEPSFFPVKLVFYSHNMYSCR